MREGCARTHSEQQCASVALTYCVMVVIILNQTYYVMFQHAACMWEAAEGLCVCVCVCVHCLRALFCTGAIKDTLEKERDYRRKKKLSAINDVFFAENNKWEWV